MRFTSIVGLVCSLYAVLLLLAHVSQHGSSEKLTSSPGIGLWNALPTINVAYSLHYNGEAVCIRLIVIVVDVETSTSPLCQ